MWATPSASTPRCSASPRTTATSRDQWPSRAAGEKGRVERSIRYVRESFFAAREFADVADLNAQARLWCDGQAADRRWPEDAQRTVREAFEAERASLLACPEREYPLGERVCVAVGKTPYVRFDLNDYSVPPTHVRRTLAVLADEQRLRVFDGVHEVACPVRSWDRGAQVDDDRHVQALVERKRQARAHRACDRLAHAAPAAAELLARAGERGHNLGSITAALLRLLERWGAAALQAAVLDALERDVPHPNAVRLALEYAREAAGRPPPVALILSEHIARRDAPVRPHALDSYDRPQAAEPLDTRGADDE